MTYKLSCPACGTKMSRWQFSPPAIYYRCRECGARLRLSAAGWIATFVVITGQFLWFVLYRNGSISNYVGIGLALLTCDLASAIFFASATYTEARDQKRIGIAVCDVLR